MRWSPSLLVLGLLVLSVPAPAADEPVEERTGAYRQFRGAFDGGDYAAALPLALRVVEISQSQYGAEAPEMVNPLTNLATTYYRLRDYGNALDTYRRALTLLDQQGDATHAGLVRPLHGLGAALRALHRDADAIAPLKRAVEITRNRDGLHAESQLPMLRALAACYTAVGQLEEAGRAQQYALSVAETAYGRNDPRLLGPLDEFARWNEEVGRYAVARVLHTRAVEIADAAAPDNIRAIDGLRGIARTYRLAYINGESEESAAAAAEMPSTLNSMLLTRAVSAPASDGERALRSALQRAQGAAGTPALRGAVMLDLGDWYLTANAGPRALASYRDAWRELTAAGDTSALAHPAMVVYRPPQVAASRQTGKDEDHDERDVELRVSIAADGDVREVTVANPAAERESAEKSVMSAVRRAVWRPAFRDGEPVATPDFLFRERVYVKRPKTTG